MFLYLDIVSSIYLLRGSLKTCILVLMFESSKLVINLFQITFLEQSLINHLVTDNLTKYDTN